MRAARRSFILALYTAVSLLGTFSFAALEPYQTVRDEIATLQDVLFDSVDRFLIQNQAESPPAFSSLGRARFSPMSAGQRAAALFIIVGEAASYAQSFFTAGIRINYNEPEHTILLKLRI
jgi:hypothetical protein